MASWYGEPFHGRLTASGERYDMEAPTAAHQTLPFGTVLRVDNLDNGRHTRVRVTDRGPFAKGRIIDLSRAAAREIEMLGPGTARVRITVLEAGLPAGAFRGCEFLQVGAFEDRANADAWLSRLRGRGIEARQVLGTGPLPGTGPVYRVLAGPIRSEAQLERLEAEFDGVRWTCEAVGDPGTA